MCNGIDRYEHFADYCGPQCGLEVCANGMYVLADDYDNLLKANNELINACHVLQNECLVMHKKVNLLEARLEAMYE